MTEQLFADGGIEAIESCSPDGGFMNQIWDGRRATVDLLADVGARKSLGFHAVVASERGYAQLRGCATGCARQLVDPAEAARSRDVALRQLRPFARAGAARSSASATPAQ